MDLSSLEAQVTDLLKKNATDFVNDAKTPGQVLTEDEIKAVFAQSVIQALPPIPELTAEATANQIADREAILDAREQIFQTVAQAEKDHQDAVNVIRVKAIKVATNVATGVLALAASSAVKAFVLQ